jgi:bifunctional non-homologous end joining protein LigD
VAAEPITVRGVRLTSPTRVLYAEQGITKRELAEYYARIERWVVPELKDRPLTLLRCPAGREKECFVQRRATDSIGAAVKRVPVDVSDEPEGTEHLAVDSIEGLLSLVQLGVLELHTWGARRDRLDRPDRLIMDLDPAPDVEFAAVVEAAVEVRETLEALGLRSFVKSTGGKGLHVVAPLARRNHWDELRAAARALAHAIADGNPERYLATSSKAERRGRIFLDYMRNAPGATAIASYSTRARPGAPVSLPLGWDELDAGFDPGEWTLRTVPERLESISVSPWAGYDGTRQSITRAMMDALGIGG